MKFNILRVLLRLNYKTIYFNFKYLPFNQAIKFPVYVNKLVYLKKMTGKLEITAPMKTGIVRIGFGDVGVFDKTRSRTIWEVSGKVIFKGQASVGHGTKISVHKDGVLTFGSNFQITAETTIVCSKSITFGKNNLISWDTLIMDTDFHEVVDKEGLVINPSKKILFGNNVWLGCRCLVLKGSIVPDWSVVAAHTTISAPLFGQNNVFGGNPVRAIKENVTWRQ